MQGLAMERSPNVFGKRSDVQPSIGRFEKKACDEEKHPADIAVYCDLRRDVHRGCAAIAGQSEAREFTVELDSGT